jgi:Fe-S-cluster containining protein
MRCNKCGLCCEKTEMLLSNADIKRLEKKGVKKQKFVYYDREGFARIQNFRGFCIFYDIEKKRCKVYKDRPLGCRIYPIIFDEEEGIIVDDLCPMKNTITKIELKNKGKKVRELLKRIDTEAEKRRITS